MIIYHFNTYVDGGAAIAARCLHDSLISFGVTSKFFHSSSVSVKNNISYLRFGQEYKNKAALDKILDKIFKWRHQKWLGRFTTNCPAGYELFSYSKLHHATTFKFGNHVLDIIHLHWISQLLDYPSFFSSIPDNFPIVWTLHDMNPFTGGCHYAWDCQSFKAKCKSCPQLNNSSNTDLSNKNFYIKLDAIKNKNIHIVADSFWLERQAKQSQLFSNAKTFRTIHYGLNINMYFPKDKNMCKQALSIPENFFVICFGSCSIDNRRKGLKELLDALMILKNKHHVVCIMFGSGAYINNMDGLPQIKSLGYINSSELQSLVYSAADLFVIPSLHEAFGQTALEAMACGTPVVGFDTGGIPDMVRPAQTGLLAKVGDFQDLAEKIRWMINHSDERVQMGKNARKMVEQEFTLELQAKKYIALYRSLIEAK